MAFCKKSVEIMWEARLETFPGTSCLKFKGKCQGTVISTDNLYPRTNHRPRKKSIFQHRKVTDRANYFEKNGRIIKKAPTFQKCNSKLSDFDECLSKAVENAVHQLTKPMKSIGLPSLAPLEIPTLTVPAGSTVVGFEQNFFNVKILGFDKPTNTKFTIDLAKKTAFLQADFDELRGEGQYNIKGKILLLPIYGNGAVTIVLKNVRGSESFVLEEYEKKGKKHLKVVSSKLTLEPQWVELVFQNLFDGNKQLGDNINKVINDNWREVFQDVKPQYEKAFGNIITSLFNSLLARIPISELFLNE